MKNMFLPLSIVALLVFSALTHAQNFSGSGTMSDPYTGTIPNSQEWIGSEIWAENLIIPSGVTLTISPGNDDSHSFLQMRGEELIIQPEGMLIVNPNAAATITDIINDGIIRLGSYPNEPGCASLLHSYYEGSGITEVRLYLSGGTTVGGDFPWHYISMPFVGVQVGEFNSDDLVQYVESLAEVDDNFPGWVAYDGYQYSSGNFLSQTFSAIELGRGYNYYSSNGGVITLEGTINTSEIRNNLSYSGSSDYQGYNLIGNPFSTFLDWQRLCNENYVRSINEAIYFTYKGSIAAYVNGVGTNNATQFIPPLQGFFVKAINTNGRVIFDPGARVHEVDKIRFKKASIMEQYIDKDTIAFLRLGLSISLDSSDLVVRFNKKATRSFDKELDAHIFSRTMGDINLWTTIGGTDYSINALPFPETSIEIPVGINIKLSGDYSLKANEIRKLDEYNILLKDLNTNQIADLSKGESIQFNSTSGMIEERFVLTINKSSTGIADTQAGNDKFKIYTSARSTINIKLLTADQMLTGSVTVFDTSGKSLLREDKVEWSGQGDMIQLMTPHLSRGVYLVVIDSGDRKYTEKIILQ